MAGLGGGGGGASLLGEGSLVNRMNLDKIWREIMRIKRSKLEIGEFYRFQRKLAGGTDVNTS